MLPSPLTPSDPPPILQLLLMLSEGPSAAASAYAFLQSAPRLAVLHEAVDAGLHLRAEGKVVLTQATLWNQAPSVATMMLPEVCVGGGRGPPDEM